MSFEPLRITRKTAETEITVALRPRTGSGETLAIPNRILSHFIDHFGRGSGVEIELIDDRWPGSWRFDHVLCEDLGQLIGRGIAALHDRRAAEEGVRGRASVVCCMDDAESEIVLTFEGRPSARWEIPQGSDIDGFVDAWYDESGRMEGRAMGTNLRQFLDGFAFGAGATLSISVRRTGNLHHLYETVFRALGDAIGEALGVGRERLPGDTSGIAGASEYAVRGEER
jgi:imidazoleglycerol-phosphate dehydratase